MLIIQCTGGLGNQMFQYAFYRKLQLDDKIVALDISGFKDYKRVPANLQALMLPELERVIKTDGLSKNVYEIVSKILG